MADAVIWSNEWLMPSSGQIWGVSCYRLLLGCWWLLTRRRGRGVLPDESSAEDLANVDEIRVVRVDVRELKVDQLLLKKVIRRGVSARFSMKGENVCTDAELVKSPHNYLSAI
jgi:hypothetical protein